jgi:plastocyanin
VSRRLLLGGLGAAALLAVATGAVLLAAAAGASAASRPRASYDDSKEVVVHMKDNDFIPQTITVDAGTVVRWDNTGRANHNVIPDKESTGWKSGTIGPGKAFEHQLKTPGAYGYFCSFHGAPGKGMYGTLIVKNPDGSVPKVSVNRVTAKERKGKPRTIRVPDDQPTIQTAVDHARPGDLVLVAPGTYREAVTVTTDRVVIRGTDRNRVVLDGGYKLDNGVKVLGANGVAVENMSARRFTSNGFFWTGVKGFRGSYLTSTRTGDYGVYAFESTDGIFDHVYGSGSPDAAVYVGGCDPCNALVTKSIGEYNGIGFSGTNANTNMVIMDSIWRHNRVGIVPNTLDSEPYPPQHGATVVGNLVYDNNNVHTPAISAAILGQDSGILLAGGNTNLVFHNRVYDHDLVGIGVVPIPDTNIWLANHNVVQYNVVSNSGQADLGSFGGEGNCFAGNRFTKSKPTDIERVMPCSGPAAPATDEFDVQPFLDENKPKSVDYRKAPTPKPPRLRGMRHPTTAKARPAVGIVVKVNVEDVRTPRAARARGG